jgi:hypothetical protein
MFILLKNPGLWPFDFALLSFGLGFAVFIYFRPFKPGWTWASVMIGVGVTILVEAAAIYTALAETGGLAPAGLPYTSWVAFAETGLPMIGGQLLKAWVQRREREDIKNSYRVKNGNG